MKFEIGDKVRAYDSEYTIIRKEKTKDGEVYYVNNDMDHYMNMTSFRKAAVVRGSVELVRKASKLERLILGLDTEQQNE